MLNKTLQLLYSDTRLLDLIDVLDQLHTAVGDGYLHQLSTVETPELLDMLRDVIYTAQETISEIEASEQLDAKPALRVLPKAAGDTLERRH